jgi:2-phosphoglycerate kinase
MSGKTTVAHRLAAILGYGCLSTDDLGAAIRAVTTKDSHPHLHPMDGYDYREYYVTRSPDELIADASLERRALWPAVQSVVRAHSAWGKPIIIEGWSLWPERVIQLRLPSVRSLWFVAHESTLQERMVNAVGFYGGASDEAAMMGHYLARSLWYNARLKEEVKKLALTSVELSPRAPVHEIVEMSLEQLRI